MAVGRHNRLTPNGLWTTQARRGYFRHASPMKTASAHSYDVRAGTLIDSQSGIATRRQLAASGISANHVRNQIQAGRWRPLGNRIVVLHNGALTQMQEQWAAVLGQTQSAALGGITAAQGAGLNWLSQE